MYIKSFDIVFLLETHITENKSKQSEEYFPGFKIYWEFAIKMEEQLVVT